MYLRHYTRKCLIVYDSLKQMKIQKGKVPEDQVAEEVQQQPEIVRPEHSVGRQAVCALC